MRHLDEAEEAIAKADEELRASRAAASAAVSADQAASEATSAAPEEEQPPSSTRRAWTLRSRRQVPAPTPDPATHSETPTMQPSTGPPRTSRGNTRAAPQPLMEADSSSTGAAPSYTTGSRRHEPEAAPDATAPAELAASSHNAPEETAPTEGGDAAAGEPASANMSATGLVGVASRRVSSNARCSNSATEYKVCQANTSAASPPDRAAPHKPKSKAGRRHRHHKPKSRQDEASGAAPPKEEAGRTIYITPT